MRNEEVIQKFLNRENAHNTNLRTQQQGDKFALVNYETPIAYIKGSELWLDKTKYSSTTSKIQGKLSYQATYTNYEVLEYNQGLVNKKGGR